MIDSVLKEENLTSSLGKLYESFGFLIFKATKFEEYNLYLNHKNFLKSDRIITFHSLDGRLLALRPDITLPIVKNVINAPNSCGKYYYIEKVYRPAPSGGDFCEMNQMGLERIGQINCYDMVEVVYLAYKTLKKLKRPFCLELSHMGVIKSLLGRLACEEKIKENLLSCILQKNCHDLHEIAVRAKLPIAQTNRLIRLIQLDGEPIAAIKQARELVCSAEMDDALKELDTVCKALYTVQENIPFTINFSIVDDLNYYNGLLFQGYVDSLPRCVLTGRRYDPLLKQFRQKMGAIGFALHLDELSPLFQKPRTFPIDYLLLYRKEDSEASILQAVSELSKGGKRVFAASEIPPALRYQKLVFLKDYKTELL